MATTHTMTVANAKMMFRALSLLPAAFGILVLLLAVMFCIPMKHDFVWWHLALGIAFGLYAFFLFRRTYLAWRRPSAELVREVCGWTAFAVLALCTLAFNQLEAEGFDLLSISVAIVMIPLVITIYVQLKRIFSTGIFGTLI